MKNIIYFIFIVSITIINGQCPDNYTVNTQYTSNTINGIIYADEDDYMCFPEEFEFFSSINQMFYFFYDVHINEYTISIPSLADSIDRIQLFGEKIHDRAGNYFADSIMLFLIARFDEFRNKA